MASRKSVSQVNDEPFRVIEKRQIIPKNGAQFLISSPCFSAHGRIDVYSKRTTDACCSPGFSELNVAQRDKPFPAETGFHRDPAPHQTGQAHLDLRRRKIFSEHLAHRSVEPA